MILDPEHLRLVQWLLAQHVPGQCKTTLRSRSRLGHARRSRPAPPARTSTGRGGSALQSSQAAAPGGFHRPAERGFRSEVYLDNRE